MVVISNKSSTLVKLDLYDKKLIYLLSQDMRLPLREAARRLRISPERVRYKVNRLLTEVLSPAINLDFVMLGFQSAVILVERLEQAAADALLHDGNLAMYFRILSRNEYLLIVVTENLESFCQTHLANAQITVYPVTNFIPDDYNAFHLNLTPIPLPKRTDYVPERRDYVLLSALAQNPIAPYQDLATVTGFDRNSIRGHIERLKSAGVILKFRYGINIFKIGMLIYFIRLQLTPESRRKLIPLLRTDPYAGFIYETYDGLFMFYMPPDQHPLFDFTSRIAERDPGARVEILQAADYFKVEPMPGNIIPVLRKRAGL